MSLLRFCEWLASTRGSVAIHESLWGYPVLESVHVLALFLFVGMAAALGLRLLGVTMRHTPVSDVVGQLLPCTVAGFAVVVVSGALLFYATPVRTYHSIFFRAKVIMLISAGVNVWVFRHTVYRRVAEWDLDPVPPRKARVAGGLSLVLWACIIILGRMIAYDWFECEKLPPHAIVSILEGCTTDSR